MATRFYLQTSGASPVSPAFSAGWNQTGDADRVFLCRKSTLATLSTLTDKSSTIPITVTQNILTRQFISEALPAGAVNGTFDAVVRCGASSLSLVASLGLVITVVSSDGGTLRGTAFSNFTLDTGVPLTGSDATRIASGQSLSSTANQQGDRLVIEIGVGVVAPLLSGTVAHRCGTTAASDFALTSGLTTDLNPWIEFSKDFWPALPSSHQFVRGSGLSFGERIR